MIYLIHFDSKLAHTQHYLGWTQSRAYMRLRLAYHASGRGARIMDAVAKAGIGFRIVRVWAEGDRNEERRMKNASHLRRHCPICMGRKSKLRAAYWRFAGAGDESTFQTATQSTGEALQGVCQEG